MAMCLAVSSPPLQPHIGLSISGTLHSYKNFWSPMQRVRIWTSIELSAFCSVRCSCSTFAVGFVFVMTMLWSL